MEELAEKLVEELNCETVFTIPIGDGIAVSESVVVTWIIMAVMLLFCFIMTRNLKVRNISRRQAVIETIVVKLENLTRSMVGERGKGLTPYLTTILMYITMANIIGIFGFKSPTKDLNVTIALALMSIVLVQAAGIHYLGFKGWLKRFTQPIAVVTPFNILDLVTRPLSLCMRLFGNVLGAFVIMKLLELAMPAPVVVPAIFSIYFDLFDGILQAYVFVFLTSLYIKEEIEEEEEEGAGKKRRHRKKIVALSATQEKKSA